jgi:hypothetical protein
MSKSLRVFQGSLAPASGHLVRAAAAIVLRWSSVRLARLSRRLRGAHGRHGRRQAPELEFYAEAGAPEGALYVDGAYVGKLPGITRL